MAKHNELGADGEDIACQFLEAKGYRIIERNFRRPYGEIDIVAHGTGGLVVFAEVKTVSYETTKGDVARGSYRPEDNIHASKLRKLGNTIQAYLSHKGHKGEWRFDVIAVYLNPKTKEAKVRHMEDVVIGA